MAENKKSHRIIPVNTGFFTEEDFVKDCPNTDFLPTILPAAKRVIAIGDIHGDLHLAIESFRLAKLIDENMEWIADPPDTIVVQVGDQIDSCRPIPGKNECQREKLPGDIPDDMNVIQFFDFMHLQAARKGGAVYSLLGNHEIMNVQGDMRYVSHENYYNFDYVSENGTRYTGAKGRTAAFQRAGPVAEILACKRNSVIVIGSTMFAHAGVLPVLARRLDNLNLNQDMKLKYLNAIVRKWLLKKLSSNYDKENIDAILKNGNTSPFWNRIYGSIPENSDLNSNQCFTSVKKTIEVFKIGHIVVGHTPQMNTINHGINGTCYESDGENTLFRVDGGFSKAFDIFETGHRVEILEIVNDREFNIIRKNNN